MARQQPPGRFSRRASIRARDSPELPVIGFQHRNRAVTGPDRRLFLLALGLFDRSPGAALLRCGGHWNFSAPSRRTEVRSVRSAASALSSAAVRAEGERYRCNLQSFPKVFAPKTPNLGRFCLFLHGPCCKDFRKTLYKRIRTPVESLRSRELPPSPEQRMERRDDRLVAGC